MVASATDVYTPPQPQVALDSFYLPKTASMLVVGFVVGMVGVLGCSSDAYLQRQFPAQVFELRNMIGPDLAFKLWKGLVVGHLGESLYTFTTCLHRGWYGPVNTIKWTASSLLFGFASIKQLNIHARDVIGLSKKSE